MKVRKLNKKIQIVKIVNILSIYAKIDIFYPKNLQIFINIFQILIILLFFVLVLYRLLMF